LLFSINRREGGESEQLDCSQGVEVPGVELREVRGSPPLGTSGPYKLLVKEVLPVAPVLQHHADVERNLGKTSGIEVLDFKLRIVTEHFPVVFLDSFVEFSVRYLSAPCFRVFEG
jgi:hypothetical protein